MKIIETALNRYFGQKAENISGGYVAPMGQANFTERDYAKVVREAYYKNAFYYFAVNFVADLFADVDILAEVDGKIEEDHPASLILQKPNDDQGATAYKRELAIYYQMAGKCFIHMPNAKKSGKVLILSSITPEYVKIVSGGVLNPIGSFKVESNGQDVEIPKEEMIYVKGFHPFNKWDAHAPIMSCATTVDLNNEQLEWNLSLLQNKGNPEFAFTGFSSPEDAKSFSDANNRQTNGSRNAGKNLYLSDVQVQKLGFSPVEMAWFEGYKKTARDILMLVGVDSIFANDGENKTYSNYETAVKAVIYHKILPMAQLFCDAYNIRLAPYFKGVKYVVDKNSIESIQDNLKERIEAGTLFYESNLGNRGEAREVAGFPKEMQTEGDVAETMKGSMIPLNQGGKPIVEEPTD